MAERPCGRADCPVVDIASIDKRRLRVTRLGAGVDMYRGARIEHAGTAFTPKGAGAGRFSPLAGRSHCYLAERRSAAILESVLHEANGPNPRVYLAQLQRCVVASVRLSVDVRVVDWRDDALSALGFSPAQLTDVPPLHYACTREVAEAVAGAKATHGFVWTSRQGRMHAERNPDGLASEVLEHRQIDVAVLYGPQVERSVEVVDVEPLASDGTPTRFVQELANLLRIAIL